MIHVEGPKERVDCNFSSWNRVVDEDGSTIAYTPDHVTARTIKDALSETQT